MPRSRLEWIAFALCLAGVVALVLVDVLPRHRGKATSAPATTTVIRAPTASSGGVAAASTSAKPKPKPRPKPKPAATAAGGGAAPARAGQPTLVLSASRGDCWVSVHLGSRTGASLYEQVLKQGESVRFTKWPLWIRFGAAGNLDATLNGKRIAAFPNGTVEVRITPKGVSSAR
jgi:Domain of unknown function (DUF4115)